jgi:hypothetical protein
VLSKLFNSGKQKNQPTLYVIDYKTIRKRRENDEKGTSEKIKQNLLGLCEN